MSTGAKVLIFLVIALAVFGAATVVIFLVILYEPVTPPYSTV